MNDDRRAEMRKYRAMAVAIELQRKQKQISIFGDHNNGTTHVVDDLRESGEPDQSAQLDITGSIQPSAQEELQVNLDDDMNLKIPSVQLSALSYLDATSISNPMDNISCSTRPSDEQFHSLSENSEDDLTTSNTCNSVQQYNDKMPPSTSVFDTAIDHSDLSIPSRVLPSITTLDGDDNSTEFSSDESSTYRCTTNRNNVALYTMGESLTDTDATNVTSDTADSIQQPGNESETCLMQPRPHFIRSNSYTLDTPSPAFLKHLLQQGLDGGKLLGTIESIQDLTINDKPAETMKSSPKLMQAGIVRGKSMESISSCSQTTTTKRTKTRMTSVKKSTSAAGSGGEKVPSKSRRPAFERVYGNKVLMHGPPAQGSQSAMGKIAARSGSTAPRRPGVIINGLALEGHKMDSNISSVSSIETTHMKPQQRRIRNIYEPQARAAAKTNRPQSGSQSHSVIHSSPNLCKPNSVQKAVSTVTATSMSSPSAKRSSPEENKIIEMISQMEVDRKRQMDELIERQECEQRRLHETFMKQQQLLIQQITENCSQMISSCRQTISPITRQSAPDIQCAAGPGQSIEPIIVPVRPALPAPAPPSKPPDQQSAVEIKHIYTSPERTFVLDVNHNKIPDKLNESDADDSSVNRIKIKFGISRKLFDDMLGSPVKVSSAEYVAATRINACARGYLTRRLFRTEDVQTVVKVIRDTLIFVINMQQEVHQPLEGDLKLKRSLLKQLNSACYMLHDIFFRKTIAQQMEIIATDRRVLATRNRLDSGTCKTQSSSDSGIQPNLSNQSTTPTICRSLCKLSMVTLFSVDIVGGKTSRSATTFYAPHPWKSLRRSNSLH